MPETSNSNKSFSVFLLVCLFASVWSCTADDSKAPDVSDIPVSSEVVRFDSLLYSIQSITDLDQMKAAYPGYFDLYFHRILGLPNKGNKDSLFHYTSEMLKAETFHELKGKVAEQYANLEEIKKDWFKAMQYYAHYFNPDQMPDLYTTLTEFAYGSFIFPLKENKDGVGVSLDMFLGDSVNYTAMAKLDPSFSAYNIRTFNRDHLIKKAVDAILDDKIPNARKSEFIHHLLREGKKYYISDHILPFISDSIIWEFSSSQWEWVQQNEWNIYTFLITNEMFFSRERGAYLKLINPAPTTGGMPPESPGRAVIYIGYKIVEEYMRRHPETTLAALIDLDANHIFQEAKYKPRR